MIEDKSEEGLNFFRKSFLLVFVLVLFGIVGVVLGFSVNFEDPTPADGANGTSIIINVSTNAIGDTYTFVDWNNSLVLWMTMDVNSSGDPYDRSSYSNNGTKKADANQTVSGYWGKGFEFDGDGDYISTSYGNEFNLSSETKFTISAWIYVKKFEHTAGILRRRVSKGIIFEIQNTNRLRGYIDGVGGSASCYSADNSIQENVWYFVTMISNGTHLSFYINGTKSGNSVSVSGVGDMTDSLRTMNIGYSTGSVYFNGTIDDVMVFNRGLSNTEILSIYNSTANKYYVNLTSLLIDGGVNYTYQAHIVNKSGDINNSGTRIFTSNKSITNIKSLEYNNRSYKSPLDINITTNFNASCKYTIDGGITNISMGSSDNRNFNVTNSSFTLGDYTIDFYCNDSVDIIISQRNFTIVEHLTWYVDNSSASCSDSFGKNYATSEDTPFCNIDNAIQLVSAGDELVIKYINGGYCEAIDIADFGISGTAEKPIIIRGENDTTRTILNGTCADSTDHVSGIILTGEDYYIFRYFYIYNFSNDGINIHSSGSDESLNNTFENITIYLNGYSAGGAPGDGISAHEAGLSISRNLNFTNNTKSCATDITNSTTWYYDSHCESPDDWGWYFGAYPEVLQRQYMEDIYSYDTPVCLRTGSNFTAKNFVCEHNNYRGSYAATLIYNKEGHSGEDYMIISGLNITDTLSSVDAIKVTDLRLLELSDGYFEGNISLNTNSTAILINMTYSGEEEVDSSSNLTRKWYLEVSANLENVSISWTNSSGSLLGSSMTNSSLVIPRQELIEYVNDAGTKSYYSNYTVTASLSGYDSQSQSVNMFTNRNLVFSLTPTTTTTTETSGGGTPTYYPTETNLQEGYSKQLAKNWKLKFKVNNESHQLKIDDVDKTNKTATITVSSESQTKILSVGEGWKVNLDGDGDYDLLVRLDNVTFTRAEVFIMEIDEAIEVDDNLITGDVVGDEVDEDNYWRCCAVGVLVLIIGFLIWVFVSGKKKKGK